LLIAIGIKIIPHLLRVTDSACLPRVVGRVVRTILSQRIRRGAADHAQKRGRRYGMLEAVAQRTLRVVFSLLEFATN
jgi:hypothetical protein